MDVWCEDGRIIAGLPRNPELESGIRVKRGSKENENIVAEKSQSKFKKAGALTPAERKQKSRNSQSASKCEAVKMYDKERKKVKRAELKLAKPDKNPPMSAAERMRLMRSKRSAQSSKKESKVMEKDCNKADKFPDKTPQTKAKLTLSDVREYDRARIEKKRALQTIEEKEEEKEKLRERVAIYRSTQSEEVKEYDKIIKRQSMREMRKNQNGNDHLISNLKAKKGMKVFREEGSLVEFRRRNSTPANKQLKLDKELSEWNFYSKKNTTQAELLERKKPDIVIQLNKAWRLKKEKDDDIKKKIEEAEKNRVGWTYNPENDSYFWKGTREPSTHDNEFLYDAPTKEESERFSKKRDKDWEVYFKTLEKEKKEERKRARNAPLPALPERSMSAYEMLREANIKERETKMIDAGFFSEFSAIKRSIGFVTKTD